MSLAGLGRPMGTRSTWEREATRAALSWLKLVDRGQHLASWTAAATFLREEVGPREWDAALRVVRAPLGRCLSREVQSRAAVLGPSDALRGPYVVIRLESRFERRGRVTETITPVLGLNGRWQVAAYFIS